MQTPQPASDCAFCGVDLREHDVCYMVIGRGSPRPLCAECARSHAECQIAADEIREAEAIIRQHQTWLASRVIL